MACTIDHLRAGARVTIIREFADADGVPHRPGDRLLLTALHVDLRARMIRIECRKGDQTHSIRLALDAPAGPGNGRMRTYFEVEDVADPTRPTPPATTAEADEALAGRTDGRRIPCGCSDLLTLPILVDPGEVGAYGCLGCGTVACARCVGDDGRFTGDSWTAWLPVPVPAAVADWLASWPRVRVTRPTRHRWPMAATLVRNGIQYLPAGFRCADPGIWERRLEADGPPATGRAAARRLRSLALPPGGPPPGLPRDLENFRSTWEASRAPVGSAVARLTGWILESGPASDLAVDLLWDRPDVREHMIEGLCSPDPALQLVGHRLALEAPPGDPDVAATAIRLLDGIPMTASSEVPGRIAACLRAERLLVLLLERRDGDPAVREVIEGFRHRVARHDPWLAGCAATALAELDRTGPDHLPPHPAIWGILP